MLKDRASTIAALCAEPNSPRAGSRIALRQPLEMERKYN